MLKHNEAQCFKAFAGSCIRPGKSTGGADVKKVLLLQGIEDIIIAQKNKQTKICQEHEILL